MLAPDSDLVVEIYLHGDGESVAVYIFSIRVEALAISDEIDSIMAVFWLALTKTVSWFE